MAAKVLTERHRAVRSGFISAQAASLFLALVRLEVFNPKLEVFNPKLEVFNPSERARFAF